MEIMTSVPARGFGCDRSVQRSLAHTEFVCFGQGSQ